MCYHCATNPSIMAVLSLLSHYGVTFTVTSSRCRLHVGHGFIVAITVSPLSSHRCSAFAVASLQFHHHHCGFVITVVVSPLHLSWFCCCRHGVAFGSVVVPCSPSWCCLHVGCGFIVAIVVSPLSLHYHGVVIAVLLLWFCCHHFVVVALLLLFCCCGFVVAVLLLLFCCCFHCCIIAVLLLPRGVIVAVMSLRRRGHGCGHGCGCGHHGHGCGRIVVIAVVVVSLWSLLLHRGRCC